jgi:hypothetical protein
MGKGMGMDACDTTETDLECAPGTTCIHGGGANAGIWYCVPWCRIGGSDCAAGTTCSSFNGAPTIRGVQYGYCQ